MKTPESRDILTLIVELYYLQTFELLNFTYIIDHEVGSTFNGVSVFRGRDANFGCYYPYSLFSTGQDHNGHDAYLCTTNDRPI
jgi:hypothetical protein